MRVFLDDERPVPDGFGFSWRSFGEAIHWMSTYGCPTFISFDHDLGNEILPEFFRSGMDVVKWMVEKDIEMNGKFIPKEFDFAVHSANPTGATNIASYLEQYLANRK